MNSPPRNRSAGSSGSGSPCSAMIRRGVRLRVVARLIAQGPGFGQRHPAAAGVGRDPEDDPESRPLRGQARLEEPPRVIGRQPGRQHPHGGRPGEAGQDAHADRVQAVPVVVHRGGGLGGRLGHAVVGVRRGEGVVRDREGRPRGEPHRVVGRREDHPRGPGPAGRLERGVAAVDVRLENARPGRFAGDPGQVDDGVRALAGGRHRVQVGYRGLDGLLTRPGGDGREVQQPQRPSRPGQPGPQHGSDEARGPGDEDDRHRPALPWSRRSWCGTGPVTDRYQVAHAPFLSVISDLRLGP